MKTDPWKSAMSYIEDDRVKVLARHAPKDVASQEFVQWLGEVMRNEMASGIKLERERVEAALRSITW